jgi:hypothetical protein
MSEKAKKDKPNQKDEKRKHFKEQFDNEDVLLVFRKHPVVMRRGLILAMFGILLGTIPGLIKPEYGVFFGGLAAGFILGLILIFPSWVRWYFSVYIMTNHRFIQQSRSLLQINVVDIGLEQIQMINYQIRGLQETLLGFGTITVQTYVGDLVIRDVHHPSRIQKKMVQILRDLGIHPSQNLNPGTVDSDNEDSEEDD